MKNSKKGNVSLCESIRLRERKRESLTGHIGAECACNAKSLKGFYPGEILLYSQRQMIDILYQYILINLSNYATFSSHRLMSTVIKHQYSSHILLLSLFHTFIQRHISLSLSCSFFVSFTREITQSVILLPRQNQQWLFVWCLCPRFLNGTQERLGNYESAISYLGCTQSYSPMPVTG